MIIQIVRFKSGLTKEEVLQKYNTRAHTYRKMKGLKQKYYLRYPETGEHGAVYVWESESAIKEFRESELGKSIAETYKIEGDTKVLSAEVLMTLYDN